MLSHTQHVRIKKLEAEVTQLKGRLAMLQPYVQHKTTCNPAWRICTCGLADIQEKK